jgi:(1->4)-alpha-D-glucan 1-alpha-D-glucosylmutase
MQYLTRLREHAPEAWIVAEKILEPGEFLRQEWPIEGTSGYDFLNVALGVLVSPEGMKELTEVYADFTGEPTDFPVIAHDKKINVTQEALGSDVNRLTSLLVDICESNRDQRDYTRAEMRRTIREVASCFAIYRSYVDPTRGEITDEDRKYISQAVECAKQQRQDIGAGLFDFVRDILTMEVKGKQEMEFLMRFQQFTPPVMAKGVEDTAFYCYNRLVAMCEVGGNPGSDGTSVEEFHAYNAKIQATHPNTMITLSTHDTKRSDDVRARLAVLSEIPQEFDEAIHRWSRMNNELRADLSPDAPTDLPDRNTEYLLYQTLIGAWPITEERLQAYMLKATREAKQKTSWTTNNAEFEEALSGFIAAILKHEPFVSDLERFVEKINDAGRVNSLAQTLLKHTSPGVPDLYQGSELWDLSLVDPDNRRPVDYGLRSKLLRQLMRMGAPGVAEEAMRRADEGLPKLWAIHQALCLRRERPQAFGAEAAYTPLKLQGAKAEHAIAYLRGDNVVTIVPRLAYGLGNDWQDTSIEVPAGRWTDRMTGTQVDGGRLKLADLLRSFPVALLVR